MASISLYIHIPFCVKKCRYCDFYSVPYQEESASSFVRALVAEWQIVKKELGLDGAEIRTIFIGGGTPTMLTPRHWEFLDKYLFKTLRLPQDVEWSIECNPDSFDEDLARLWLSRGVTRLTFGIQSLEDRELEFLGRPHSAAKALAVLDSPVLSRFKSIGADLMYGLPGQTAASFERTLTAILSRPCVSHLSAYELTVNPHTPIGRHVSIIPFPSEETVLDMSRALYESCEAHSFERYEISNFSRVGHRCRHNEAYWDHSPYIGLGPSAHSFINGRRFANTGDVRHYIASIRQDRRRPIKFTETIDRDNLAAEMIFLRLRTTDGLAEDLFETQTGQTFYGGGRIPVLDELIKENMMTRTDRRWQLTTKGMFVADAIAKKLV
jgi:oxygen-independent coproporphyrinogen-3 oxidase